MIGSQSLLVLFGDSLILDSVEASLAVDQSISVLRLRTAHPEVAERLQSLDPSLVIFDLDAPNLRSILPFLRAQPGALLLGIDVSGDVAVSLTCTHHLIQNQIDLQEVVRTHMGSGIAPSQTSRSVTKPGTSLQSASRSEEQVVRR